MSSFSLAHYGISELLFVAGFLKESQLILEERHSVGYVDSNGSETPVHFQKNFDAAGGRFTSFTSKEGMVNVAYQLRFGVRAARILIDSTSIQIRSIRIIAAISAIAKRIDLTRPTALVMLRTHSYPLIATGMFGIWLVA